MVKGVPMTTKLRVVETVVPQTTIAAKTEEEVVHLADIVEPEPVVATESSEALVACNATFAYSAHGMGPFNPSSVEATMSSSTTETTKATLALEEWRYSKARVGDPTIGPGDVEADAYEVLYRAKCESIPLEKLVPDANELRQLKADADKHVAI
jgi:hypothetical protein